MHLDKAAGRIQPRWLSRARFHEPQNGDSHQEWTVTTLSKGLRSIASAALVLILIQAASGQTETVLYSFCSQFGCPDGIASAGVPIMDKAGNLYGTTVEGGTSNAGTVFEFSVDGVETVLHSFALDGVDGFAPFAGLVMDKSGNLYGTTTEGGPNHGGTVFEVTPSGTETVLYSFCSQTNCKDGRIPSGGLIIDSKGDLYGMTNNGGANGGGTVFKLGVDGTEKVLYSFCSQPGCADGETPEGGLIRYKGYFYGTTNQGGANGVGTVFKLNARGRETVLYSFANNGTDGYGPLNGVVADKNGNLYGTTVYSALGGYGTVFKLGADGGETILYNFCPKKENCPDGSQPSSVILDKKGNLYGTTFQGGAKVFGTVFEVTPNGTETVLHSFTQHNGDGAYPDAGLLIDKKGNLYGTTEYGGAYSHGTIFKLTP